MLKQPLFRGLILAFGAMAVLARVIAVQGFITRFTMVDVTAQGLGAALFNRGHRQPVTERHALAEFLPIFGAVTAEDLGHLGHDYNIVDGKYVITEIGKAHAGHSAPQPKSLKWKNPFGEMEGFEEAAEIIRKYALPEMVTPYGKQWETIVRSEAAKIILGDISAEQGVENMQRRFKEEGVYK